MSSMISLFDYFAQISLSPPRSESRHHISCVANNEASHTKLLPTRSSSLFNSPRSSATSSAHPSPPMALHIQMPSTDPILRSSTPAASPPSRPNSPHYRPGSRSERLLRDTLRKADERQPHSPSLTRRTSSGHRRPTDREQPVDEFDEGVWLNNSRQLSRRQSIPLTPSPTKDEASLSTSPAHPPLSRTHTSPSLLHHRASSSSTVPTPRPSASRAGSPSPSSSFQRSGAIAPHEAVLRSRLENVLSRVNTAPQSLDYNGSFKVKASPRMIRGNFEDHRPGHSRSQSLAASPTVHSEWPWAGSPDPPESMAPLTPPPTPPSSTSPLSSPPSPFNARAANQICRQMPAYVSFQDVEGLGEPPNTEDEGTDEDKGKDDKKWWNWPWSGRARAQSQ